MGNKQNKPIRTSKQPSDHGRRNDKSVRKLLLLGGPYSGKTTIFKTLRHIHGYGYSNRDRSYYKEAIFCQVVEQMQKCIDCIDLLKEDDKYTEYKEIQLTDIGTESAKTIQGSQSGKVCNTTDELIF